MSVEVAEGFCEKRKSWARVEGEEREPLSVYVGLRREYVMSPWVFNFNMDGVVKALNGRFMGGKTNMF